MTMERHQDWPEQLAAFLDQRQAAAFAWGKNDCALFTCDAVLAITGVDMAEGFRGKYSTLAGATKTIRQFAGGGLAELAAKVTAALSAPEIHPLKAQRGDVVLFETEQGPALGIVDLNGVWARTVGPEGAVDVPVKQCTRAWRI